MTRNKVDKVRRLLANRYGKEGQQAILKLMGNVNDMLTSDREGLDTGLLTDMTPTEVELVEEYWNNLFQRANMEVEEVPKGDELVE